MTRPRQHLLWMAIGLVAVIALAWLLSGQIYIAFLHNPALNSGIFVVLLIGMAYIFWQVVRLYPEIAWIERFKRGDQGTSGDAEPRLLAPMAAMVRERTGRLTLSTAALRSLLDSISSRLDESRDISRYFIGLMVFLGLLGTFWGLLGTISGVAEAIGSISVSSGGDVASLQLRLKDASDRRQIAQQAGASVALHDFLCRAAQVQIHQVEAEPFDDARCLRDPPRVAPKQLRRNRMLVVIESEITPPLGFPHPGKPIGRSEFRHQ